MVTIPLKGPSSSFTLRWRRARGGILRPTSASLLQHFRRRSPPKSVLGFERTSLHGCTLVPPQRIGKGGGAVGPGRGGTSDGVPCLAGGGIAGLGQGGTSGGGATQARRGKVEDDGGPSKGMVTTQSLAEDAGQPLDRVLRQAGGDLSRIKARSAWPPRVERRSCKCLLSKILIL
jgi:hypothetical protein